jgi:hypothetical protein
LCWKNLGVAATTMRVVFGIATVVCSGRGVATLVEELQLFQGIAATVFAPV